MFSEGEDLAAAAPGLGGSPARCRRGRRGGRQRPRAHAKRRGKAARDYASKCVLGDSAISLCSLASRAAPLRDQLNLDHDHDHVRLARLRLEEGGALVAANTDGSSPRRDARAQVQLISRLP